MSIGTAIVLLIGFIICATGFGFFRAAFAQRKADKEAAKVEAEQRQIQEQEEAEKRAKKEAWKKSKQKPKDINRPKRLVEQKKEEEE